MKSIIVAFTLLFAVAGCETGHVVEITMPARQAASRSVDAKTITECLQAVAQTMGMEIEGPTSGPAAEFELTARYATTSAISGFFISAQISGDRVSIVFRRLYNQVDPALAERGFVLFKAELDRRGLAYDVRRN